LISGILISIPAMFNHEYLSLPALCGNRSEGGLVRDCAFDKEDIWRFSPFFDLNLVRALRRGQNYPRALLYWCFSPPFFSRSSCARPSAAFIRTLVLLKDIPAAVYASTFFSP